MTLRQTQTQLCLTLMAVKQFVLLTHILVFFLVKTEENNITNKLKLLPYNRTKITEGLVK